MKSVRSMSGTPKCPPNICKKKNMIASPRENPDDGVVTRVLESATDTQ
jgi:hypothetical protein